MRNSLISFIGIIVLAVAGLAMTFGFGWSPLLGLDLQGGVSVVLEPTEPAEEDQIAQAIEIIRKRVDGIGVAEPEITRQGDSIVVQLPGVEDQQRALELVGQTAELQFRPVVDFLASDVINTIEQGGLDTGAGDSGTGDSSTDDSSTDETDAGDGEEEEGFAGTGEVAFAQTTTTTEAPTEEPEPVVADTVPSTDDILDQLALTPKTDTDASESVVLASYDEEGNETVRYVLGPTDFTGTAVSGAEATLAGVGAWTVNLDIKPGDEGVGRAKPVADSCMRLTSECPTQLMAIVLDGEVLSAPRVNTDFSDGRAVVSGDFDQQEAQDLATAFRYGALPVELEPQESREISASLGEDALDAGVIAGLVGLGLVAIYMIAYYRILGVVAMASLAISGALLWTMISFLGEKQGLALTLAGVTGIIVSIGVSVDSNVVYFENLKEDLRNGRALRSAVDRSFKGAFSTIVKADTASLIGAGLLYWLTVGPVRGFALFLGLSTMLDLVVSYFFLKPAAQLLGRVESFEDDPSPLGLPPIAEELRVS